MDQQSIDYSMRVFDEIEEAIRPIGLAMKRLDLAQTGGIPTGVIVAKKRNGNFWEISCNVLPVNTGDISTTYIQLYVQLTDPAPDRREEVSRYVRGCNEKFLLGTLLTFRDCVCMKYTLALDALYPLEEHHFQNTIFAFCQQAEQYAALGEPVCGGTMSAEDALTSIQIQ